MKVFNNYKLASKYTKNSILVIGNLDGVHKGHQRIIKSAKDSRENNGIVFLDEIDKIKVCVGYKVGQNKYNYLPFDENIQNKLVPIYETIPGWQTSTFGLTSWKDLPKKAQNYISFLESKIEKNISIISTGPDRIHTIDRKSLLSYN